MPGSRPLSWTASDPEQAKYSRVDVSEDPLWGSPPCHREGRSVILGLWGPAMNRKRVGILLFNNVEVLDFCGPFEVFNIARMDEEHRQDPSPFEVVLVAETRDTITTSGGMKVLPMASFAGCPPLDLDATQKRHTPAYQN